MQFGNILHYKSAKSVEVLKIVDDGVWLYDYGYHYIGQLEPPYYLYRNKYIVYRSGVSVWLKDNTEVTDEIANRLISTVEHRAE